MADYDNMTISELALEMQSIRKELDEAKKNTATLRNIWDTLRKSIIPEKLEEMGLDSVKVQGVGTVSKRFDAYCNTVPGTGIEFYKWLREQKAGDLIKDNVNSSTLKAFMKERMKNGEEIPEEYVTFSPYTYVAITK